MYEEDSVCFLASDALFNIPLFPVKILIVTPEKIKRTIIVITSAIIVIPLFFICLFPPLFFIEY